MRPTQVRLHQSTLNPCQIFLTSVIFLLLGRPTESTGSTAVHKSSTLGSFYHLPPYLKLYDVLKATHANFKVHLYIYFKLLLVSAEKGVVWD